MNDAAKLFEQPARVGSMIWIPGAVGDEEALPVNFEEFCEDLPETAEYVLYAQLPVLAQFAGKYPDPEAVADALRDRRGFLVRAETPNKKFDGPAETYSWGYYRRAWIYAPTEDAIADLVVAWAKSVDAKNRAKAED